MPERYRHVLLVLFVLALARGGTTMAATCQSNATGNWNAAGTWINCGGGIPTAADDVQIRNGDFVTIPAAVNAVARSVTFTSSSGQALISHAANTSTLTVGSGGMTINPSTGTDDEKGWLLNDGTGTVNGSITINASTISDLRPSGILITTGTLNVNGANGNDGDITMSNSSSNIRTEIRFTGAGNLNITRSFMLSGGRGTLTPSTGRVTYTSASTASVAGGAAITYNNLTINKPSGTGSLTGTTTVAADLTVTAGTFDLATFTANRSAAGGTITVANAGTLKIGSTNSFPTNYTTHTLGATSTVEYGGSNQVVPIENYGSLTLSGSGSKTIGTATLQTLTLGANLTIASGVTYNGTSFNPTVNIAGNFSNVGTFNSGTGTYTFNGTAAQTLTGPAGGTTIFTGPFRVSNANGLSFLPLAGVHVVQANNTVTLLLGRITTNANVLYVGGLGGGIGNAGSGAGTAADPVRFVIGNVRKRVTTGASVARAFEVGTNGGNACCYARISATFNVSGGVAGDFTVSTTVDPTTSHHPQIGNSTLDGSKSVNRYWTFTNNSVTFNAAGTNTFVFTFNNPADLDAGVNTANFFVSRYAPPLPSLPPTSSWTEITPTGRTGTTTTIQVPPTNLTGDYQIAQKLSAPAAPPGGFDAFETSQADTASPKVIRTKVASGTTGFTLSIMAMQSGGAKQTTFTGTGANVKLELIGVNTLGTLTSANCPTSGATVLQTIASFAITNGRSDATFAAVPNSWRDVRVRISYPTTSPTVTSCSSDNFAIRPNAFTGFSVSHNDQQTAGTNFQLDTTTIPGGAQLHKAGRPFTVAATAVSATGATTTNYVLAPSATLAACGPGAGFEACTASFGTLTPLPVFAAGVLSTTASYDNVGAFALQLVDSNFASVDASDGSTTAERNITSSVLNVGRFIPDHFAASLNVTSTTPAFTTGCTGFTYLGQTFTYGAQPQITVTAQAAANTTTTFYTGTLWQITTTSLTYPAGTNRGYKALSGTLNVSALDPVIAVGSGGTGTLTFGSGTGFSFTRGGAPIAAFDAELSLAINVIDADGVSYASNPAKFGNETATFGMLFTDGKTIAASFKQQRFGRLAAGSRNAAAGQPVALPLEAQYWDSTMSPPGFVLNTLDSCTPFASGNVGLGNYAGKLTAATASVGAGTFSVGRNSVTVTPGSANPGSVDLVFNLGTNIAFNSCLSWGATPPTPAGANLTHLRGQWCGTAYDRDPTARATFGTKVGAEEVIYLRENF